MCALFGSPDIETFKALAWLNRKRGSHSYSVSTTNQSNSHIDFIVRDVGDFRMPDVVGSYYIGHIQAPTTEAKDMSNIHPAQSDDMKSLLWHNGILFETYVKEMQEDLDDVCKWDTKLFQKMLLKYGFDILSTIKGSFACVLNNGYKTYLFRNENCPLFTDGKSYSSTWFQNSNSIKPNVIYELANNKIEETTITFSTAQEFFWTP